MIYSKFNAKSRDFGRGAFLQHFIAISYWIYQPLKIFPIVRSNNMQENRHLNIESLHKIIRNKFHRWHYSFFLIRCAGFVPLTLLCTRQIYDETANICKSYMHIIHHNSFAPFNFRRNINDVFSKKRRGQPPNNIHKCKMATEVFSNEKYYALYHKMLPHTALGSEDSLLYLRQTFDSTLLYYKDRTLRMRCFLVQQWR